MAHGSAHDDWVREVSRLRRKNRDSTLSNLGSQIVALSTEIGRGHPSYLDSVLAALRKRGVAVASWTVFQQSRGLSLLAWRFVAFLYAKGGRGGAVTRLYNSFRSGQVARSADSLAVRVLGRDLRTRFEGFRGVCLVAHPVVANILSSTCPTWYVHGEIAAPPECAVKGVERIFVPIEETAERLVASGADARSTVVTGLMIEEDLLESRKRAFVARLERIESGQPLTIGFFTSGAYPSEHMRKIVAGAKSLVDKNMKVVIFCGTNWRVVASLGRVVRRWGRGWVEERGNESLGSGDWRIKLVSRRKREDETKRAVQLVPKLDAFVAASHERTHWAVGLGLPMFVLFPLIGTFARQNCEFALKQGAACPLATLEAARNMGSILNEVRRSGRLTDMARRGFGVLKVHGIDTIASQVVDG